jgi:hypothetical protein
MDSKIRYFCRRCHRVCLRRLRCLCLAIFFRRHFLAFAISSSPFINLVPVYDKAHAAVVAQYKLVGLGFERRARVPLPPLRMRPFIQDGPL